MLMTKELADELPVEAVGAAKARAATLLLAFRHGNQLAFDAELDRLFEEHVEREVTTLLVWIAAETVRKAYAPEVGDRALRSLARRAPAETAAVATDEEAAEAARLIEAVNAGDIGTVRAVVAATPDTTYLLGGLLQAVAMMLPLLPEGEAAEIAEELRRRHGARSRIPEARHC